MVSLGPLILHTIADKKSFDTSIPMILANLEKNKYLKTLDLESGYHQIYLAEQDSEKTSFYNSLRKVLNTSYRKLSLYNHWHLGRLLMSLCLF